MLTVAVADKLLYNPERLNASFHYGVRYKQYYSRYKDAGFGQAFSKWASSNDMVKQRSYGNGGAMRVCPIGYAFDTLEDVLWEAKASCLYTHNNREAIKGAKAVAGCVFIARNQGSKQDIIDFINKYIGYNLNFTLNEIRADYKFDSRTRYSVPPAIKAFLESDSYEDAVRKAISIGGDSDTIACIAGGIAHAFYSKIPENIHTKCMRVLDIGLKRVIHRFCDVYGVGY